jgi:catechol 2,3-dioxygenase-like lactoylglutathione lyase family enzyme
VLALGWVFAADLARARSFYADVLGLSPVTELGDAGMLIYRTDGGRISASTRPSTPAEPATPSRSSTSTTWWPRHALQAKGVALETYDMPGVEWDDGIASLVEMGQAAWFKDSEGNILCLDSGFPQG